MQFSCSFSLKMMPRKSNSCDFALPVLDGNIVGKSCVIYFMRTETLRVNTHELDACMNFLIRGMSTSCAWGVVCLEPVAIFNVAVMLSLISTRPRHMYNVLVCELTSSKQPLSCPHRDSVPSCIYMYMYICTCYKSDQDLQIPNHLIPK